MPEKLLPGIENSISYIAIESILCGQGQEGAFFAPDVDEVLLGIFVGGVNKEFIVGF
jgi:hypothetical protein